jgi:hypothetical protein
VSGSIIGLLGALDQATQQQNSIQQPNVQGLLGSATQLLPTDPFAAQKTASPNQDWANQFASVFGKGRFLDLATPDLLQNVAQGHMTVSGVSQKDAQDELDRQNEIQRQRQAGANNTTFGNGGGGGTESGGGGGGGEINAGGM